MQCHSTTTELYLERADHKASLADVRGGQMSCASAGCHGLAHPFFGPISLQQGATAKEKPNELY